MDFWDATCPQVGDNVCQTVPLYTSIWSELKHQGLIIDTDKRRKNEYDNTEIIYKLRDISVIEDYGIDINKTY